MKYSIVYQFSDYDSLKKQDFFKTWKSACRFMKGLLDDGYIILEVNG
jgi:hypothetical protein